MSDNDCRAQDGIHSLTTCSESIQSNMDQNFVPLSSSDLALLHPSQLQLARPLRAWERKPLSPFARSKTGAKKIWKRAGTLHSQSRSVPLQTLSQSSSTPTKTTKRRCVSSHESIETQFDRLESPQKRIVTRSSHADDLVALPDEDGEGDVSQVEDYEGHSEVDGTVIEELDQHGHTIGICDTADACEWTDEEDVEVDNTMLHLGEAVDHEIEGLKWVSGAQDAEPDKKPTGAPPSELQEAEPSTKQHFLQNDNTTVIDTSTTLPAGFVSPVRRHRTVSKRLRAANRRQSVPYAFAPEIRLPTSAKPQHVFESNPEDDMEMFAATEDAQVVQRQLGADSISEVPETSNHVDQEPRESEHEVVEKAAMLEDNAHHAASVITDNNDVEAEPPKCTPPRKQAPPLTQLRRSPRRKSSSPLKPRILAQGNSDLHYVALSPARKTQRVAADPDINNIASEPPTKDQEAPMVVLQSPLAADQAEGGMHTEEATPRKTTKGRLSDDTAFLQAFLSRAAESKSSAGLDVASKEAMFNRRDSGTVKEAMSSPGKATVLQDVDPNVVSPSKRLTGKDLAEVNLQDDCDMPNGQQQSPIQESSTPPRRSGRDRQAVERSAPIVPTRIMLRGTKPMQSSKSTEMQALLALTKKNTRSNKGDAVLPLLRLEEIADELGEGLLEDHDTNAVKKSKVTWNDVPEVFVLAVTATQAEGEAKAARRASTTISTLSRQNGRIGRAEAKQISPSARARRRKLRPVGTPAKLPLSQTADDLPLATASLDDEDQLSTEEEIQVLDDLMAAKRAIPVTLSSQTGAASHAAKIQTPAVKNSLKPKSRLPSRLPAPKLSFAAALEAAKTNAPSARDEVLGASLAMASPAKRRGSVFDRKLFSSSTIPPDVEHSSTTPMPSLASPAKKIRRAVIFGTGQLDGNTNEVSTKVRETPGMNSPAKKRMR